MDPGAHFRTQVPGTQYRQRLWTPLNDKEKVPISQAVDMNLVCTTREVWWCL